MRYRQVEYNSGATYVPDSVMNEICGLLSSIKVQFIRGNIPIVRKSIRDELLKQGWSPEVQLDSESKMSITSVKKRVGLCLQTGNMARVYADLLKLQTMYLRQIIRSGVIILPNREGAKDLGDNVANMDRLSRELMIFSDVISIPLVVFGIQE